MYSRQQLANGFRALGVAPGDTIMLHASVRAVGRIAGGPDQIHLALADALTPAGTLMMYAGCPEHYDEIGRGNLTADEERELLEKLPAFDPLTARAARDNGALVEFFRSWPGSIANAHVARFVARGARAAHLTASTPWNYAFGRGSALDRFVDLDGRILLLGCDHDNVTFLHYAEHIVDVPGKRVARFQVPVEERGRRVWRGMEEVDTSSAGAHASWPDRFFARIVDAHLARTANDGGRVGDARSFLIDSRGLLAFALRVMTSVAADARAAVSLLSWAVVLTLAAPFHASAQENALRATYEWVGDCPAACCGYAADWTATQDAPAWSEPSPPDVRAPRGEPAFVVGAGDTVRALTGSLQVLERGRAVMREDFSTDASYANLSARHRQTITLLAGDEVPLLAPRGEDTWRIWHRGRIVDAHLYRIGPTEACAAKGAGCAGVIVQVPVTRWWVMILNRQGQVGWVEAAGRFDTPACP